MGNSPKSGRWGRAIRYFGYLTAAFVVVVAAAAILLPEILDRPAVRSEIQGRLSRIVGGEVAWEKLSIRILPSPRGVLQRARIEIPGVANARAEEIDVHLQFWPLLHGRVEIVAVSVVRPEIRIDIAPSPPADGQTKEVDASSPDPVAIYRSVMEPVSGLVRQFAPDAVVAVEDGIADVRAPGMLPIELRGLSIRAQNGVKSMELVASAAGNYWSRLKLSMRVEYADLAATASLDAADIKPQAWLDRSLAESPVRIEVSAANVRAQASYDAKTSLECDFDMTAGAVDVLKARERVQVADVAVKGKVTADAQEIALGLAEVKLGASRLHGVKLRYEMKSSALAGGGEFDLDLKQGMDYTRRLAPEETGAVLAQFQSVTGRAQGSVKLDLGQPNWSVGVDVRQSDVAVQIRDLPGPVRLAGGAVEMDRHNVKVDRVALSMPAGKVLLSTLRHSFKDGATTGGASFDLDLANALELVRRVLPEKDRAVLAGIESVTGRAQGNLKFSAGRKNWTAGVNILKSDSSVQIRDLPGPVRLGSGSLEIDPGTVKIDRAAVSMLDAQALVSATVSNYRTDRLQAIAAMPEGVVGEKLLAWIWQLAKAPPHLELKTPIRVAATRVAWGPKQALDVAATARFDSGPAIAVELGWTPKSLHIRRIAIKDERSDATIALRTVGRSYEGRFSGSLDITSIAAMLKNAKATAGRTTGDLRFTVDRERPQRTVHDGKLSVEALDLEWLLQQPVVIDRIDLEADGSSLRIGEATIKWAGQRATIRGEVKYGAGGPVINAQFDSPGVIVDALLPREDKTAGEKPPAAKARSKQTPDGEGEASWLWPLPVTGRIAVRSDFVQSGHLKVAPVAATLVLEERRAHLDLTQAQLCGISLPLTIEAASKGLTASAQVTAQKQPLEQTVQCLSDQRVEITGDFDLKADISTQGEHGELVRNLKGTVRAEMHGGRVMKSSLLGSILSVRNVAASLEKRDPKLKDAGLPYRTLTVAGRFEKGRFILEEGAFRSDEMGLAAAGWISMLDYQCQLTVLFAPLGRIDRLVRNVPIVGYIIGGTFTSVPVGVSGDIRDPRVVPLGPKAITSQLVGIFERTLKLPGKLIESPEGGGEAQPPDGK